MSVYPVESYAAYHEGHTPQGEDMPVIFVGIEQIRGLPTFPVCYRVVINERPWMYQGIGWNGVGYLFPSQEEAREIVMSWLHSQGYLFLTESIEGDI